MLFLYRFAPFLNHHVLFYSVFSLSNYDLNMF